MITLDEIKKKNEKKRKERKTIMNSAYSKMSSTLSIERMAVKSLAAIALLNIRGNAAIEAKMFCLVDGSSGSVALS